MSIKIKQIIALLSESKAEDIQTFEMPEYICENVIIATSLNSVHSYSLAEKVRQRAKLEDLETIIDGDAKDGWVVVEIPGINTMVHLMFQEKRDFYNIEEILESHNAKQLKIAKKQTKAKKAE